MKPETVQSPTPPRTLAEVAVPGLLISNAWPQSRATRGATARAIEQVRERFPFFEAIQTVDIPYPEERRVVRSVLRGKGVPHTYALTRVLAEQQLNLSSIDAAVRKRSSAVVIERFDEAEEVGAEFIGLISGNRPVNPAGRDDALNALEESLSEICGAAKGRPLNILIEPLDYEAHKRCTLGTTPEAVGICERLGSQGLPLLLCIDTAHVLLNDEEVRASVVQSRAYLGEFHFCNCVKDRTHPLFGDRHLPFGPPGIVDVTRIGAILADLWRDGFLGSSRPRVYCEVWKPDDQDSLAVVAHCQDALERGWALARGSVNEPETLN